MNKYLIIDQNDNVAVALKDIFKGEIVHNITIKSDIKVGHKFALKNIMLHFVSINFICEYVE